MLRNWFRQPQPRNNIPKIGDRRIRLRLGAGINLAVLVHPNRMPAGILRSLNIMLERVSNEKHLVRLQSPLITCIIENLRERLADLKFALDQNMVKELLDSQCSNFLPLNIRGPVGNQSQLIFALQERKNHGRLIEKAKVLVAEKCV